MSGPSFSPARSDSTAFQLKQEILSGQAKPADRLAEAAGAAAGHPSFHRGHSRT